jgi:hypothetical protein
MSSEWNDPEASWQQSNQLNWGDESDEYEDSEPPPDAHEVEAHRSQIAQTQSSSANAASNVIEDDLADENAALDQSEDVQANDDEAQAGEPARTRFAAFREFGEHLLPIFIPLVLAGFTFLFILPLVLRDHYYIDAAHLWPVGLVIAVVAILQGTVLFYADTNDVYWSLAIGIGFCLFVLIGVFTVFGPTAALIVLLFFVVIAFIFLRMYMHRVQDGYVEIVNAFGTYARTLYPGINFQMPWETIAGTIETREIIWTCPEQQVQMSHDEDVRLKATVSYQLAPEDAHLIASRLDRWERDMHDLICSELQIIAGALHPDDFLPWPHASRSQQQYADIDEQLPWERISELLREKLSDKVALWGVQINSAQLRDITLTPHVPVAAASNAAAVAPAAPLGGSAQSQPALSQAQYASVELDNDATERIEQPFMSQPATAGFAQGNSIAASSPMRPGKIPDEQALIRAYKQVQMGKIKTPAVIRRLAANFQAIAADPVLNQNVSFNAESAAKTLNERADMYERHLAHTATAPNINQTMPMTTLYDTYSHDDDDDDGEVADEKFE